MYDFCVLSEGADAAVKDLVWCPHAGWRSHRSLELVLRATPVKITGPQLAVPKSFPLLTFQAASSDPNSKAARRRNDKALKYQEKASKAA